MIDLPKDIEKYLVSDEVVEKQFTLKNCTAYASTNRLFFKKGNKIRDIDYNHISSIGYESRPNWLVILVGILAAVVGYFLQHNSTLLYALLIAGVVLFISGFIWKIQKVELTVVGMVRPWRFSGHRDSLDLLFKLVRERSYKRIESSGAS